MPEGHTVHRIARDQRKYFVGEKLIATSPQGRFRAGARRISGRTLEAIDAHGKHLFYLWDNSLVLHVHLGRYGKFRVHKSPPPEPRGAVRWRAVGPTKSTDLNGPTACEVISRKRMSEIVGRLGQDPLRSDADPDKAWQRISRSRAALGTLLLNQSVIAGVGNIFRADVLFDLRIHPNRPGMSLSRDEFDQLWSTLERMLKIGVKYNRIITVDASEAGKPIGRLLKDERLLVYKKQYCCQCDGKIESWKLAARTIYACQKCQT